MRSDLSRRAGWPSKSESDDDHRGSVERPKFDLRRDGSTTVDADGTRLIRKDAGPNWGSQFRQHSRKGVYSLQQ